MTRPLDGRVAFITGAARGQGRSHAVRLASQGADIVAVDICKDLDSLAYPLASAADLERTVAEVEQHGGRILAREVDVRDFDALCGAVGAGVARFGGLDIVLANAGIGLVDPALEQRSAFREQLDINLVGVWNTVHASVPALIERGRGGSVVLTGSVLGLTGRANAGSGNADGYLAAKHAVVGLTHGWARWLAPHNIRVNSVHPSGVRTPMVVNDAMDQIFATFTPQHGTDVGHLLDVIMLEPADVSGAVAWLVSDEARYITGVALPVDAGFVTP